MKKYKPIACSLYDYYELLIREKQQVIIKTDSREIEALIINIYTKEHVEYIDLDNATTLRLDTIKKISNKNTTSINGVRLISTSLWIVRRNFNCFVPCALHCAGRQPA